MSIRNTARRGILTPSKWLVVVLAVASCGSTEGARNGVPGATGQLSSEKTVAIVSLPSETIVWTTAGLEGMRCDGFELLGDGVGSLHSQTRKAGEDVITVSCHVNAFELLVLLPTSVDDFDPDSQCVRLRDNPTVYSLMACDLRVTSPSWPADWTVAVFYESQAPPIMELPGGSSADG